MDDKCIGEYVRQERNGSHYIERTEGVSLEEFDNFKQGFYSLEHVDPKPSLLDPFFVPSASGYHFTILPRPRS